MTQYLPNIMYVNVLSPCGNKPEKCWNTERCVVLWGCAPTCANVCFVVLLLLVCRFTWAVIGAAV